MGKIATTILVNDSPCHYDTGTGMLVLKRANGSFIDVRPMTAREFAEQFGEIHSRIDDGDAFRGREPFYLYRHAGSRFKVTVEHHQSPGFALGRAKADPDVDAVEFAKDFVAFFCDELSIHDLNILIPAIIKARDDWEAERQAARM